ncbi:Hypothetical predicted protein [Octopus vulgaris]|uniref:Uncharacterized protein n=1 Tax=Octopus vulgaris TaxID=6645 RepID=A0AA36F3F8_OCTVU|nr:Hypothetical predicted protein [Octopus vulgaris]
MKEEKCLNSVMRRKVKEIGKKPEEIGDRFLKEEEMGFHCDLLLSPPRSWITASDDLAMAAYKSASSSSHQFSHS